MSRKPLYRALAEDLRGQIVSGALARGTLLPGELELCATHGVSRHTARDALRLLMEEGLIERRRGAGTVVAAARTAGPFSQAWGGVSDILDYARGARLVVRAVRDAKEEDLAAMGLPLQQAWRCVSGIRVRHGDGLALAVTRICVRDTLLPPRADIEAWPGALAELIEARSGVSATRVAQEIAAVAIDRSSARQLDVRAGGPALRTVRRYLDATGTPFQASLSLHPGDRFTYTMLVGR